MLDKAEVINKQRRPGEIVLKDIRKSENLFYSVKTRVKNNFMSLFFMCFYLMVIFSSFCSKSAGNSGLARYTQGFPQSYPQLLWKTGKAML